MGSSTHHHRTGTGTGGGKGGGRAKVIGVGVVVAAALVGGAIYAFTGGSDGSDGTDGAGAADTANVRFAPYVDTGLPTPYDMVGTAAKTGVDQFTLGFVTSGGGCDPKWGGERDLTTGALAAQISEIRAKGGDVRVSFGGRSGTELATACASVSDLAAAYGKAIDTYKLTKVDFDIEGAALSDTAAGTRRAQAIARLQKSHPGLDVSLTLPVTPDDGLSGPATAPVSDARHAGVKIGAVNIMAMDYGSSYDGDMGEYAIQAATTVHKQIKDVLGLSDAAAWRTLTVTPMVGVNDVKGETFTVDDAAQLVSFAKSKDLGGLSMWSATRDKQCAGGAKAVADPSCSSITQQPLAFTKEFAAHP